MSLFQRVLQLLYMIVIENVEQRLEPGEMPSTLGVSPRSKLCATFLNIAKYFKRFGAVAVRLWLFFFNLLIFSTVSE